MKKIYLIFSLLISFCCSYAQLTLSFGSTFNATCYSYDYAGNAITTTSTAAIALPTNIDVAYPSATLSAGFSTSGSNLCNGALRRTQVSTIILRVATQSVGTITIHGQSSGSSIRNLTTLETSTALNGTYTSITFTQGTSTISSSTTCGNIPVSAVNIPAGTYIRFTFSGNLNLSSFVLTASSPSLTTSVSTLSGFTQSGATPSASQNYTVSGAALTGTTVDLTAPTSYEISTDNTTWNTTLSLPVSAGIITGQPKTIYTRLNDATAGAHSGNITNASTGATTLNVAVSGNTVSTPTISTSPSSLAFGSVLVGTTSAAQSYNLSAILLTPAAGNITVTAPTGYEVSLASGSGFATSIIVAYTGGTLASTPIYVHLVSTAVSTYNGNISNAGGGATTVYVAVTGAGALQSVGDYGSVASGNWGTVGTWKQWDGSGFNTTPSVVPTASDNVWINAGNTVNVEASSKNCKNLVVNGTLTSSSLVNNPYYVNINGSIFQVNTGGFVGNSTTSTGDAADGISVNLVSASLIVNGTGGSIYLSRFKTNAASTTVTIDHDMTLNYHGGTNQGGHTIAYYPTAGDNSTLSINAGRTMTFAPWACLATTASGNGLSSLSMTVNVNGTLQLANAPVPNATVQSINSYIYGGEASGKTFTLNVGATGIVNTPEFYPNGTVSGDAVGTGTDAVITVAAGGQLNVSNIGDFRKPSQTVTGAGAFSLIGTGKLRIGSTDGITASSALGPIQTSTRNYSTLGAYAYEGTAAQVTGDGLPANFSGLIINNAAHVTLTNPTTPVDSLKLTLGDLILGTNYVKTNLIIGGSSTSYVVTNNTGALTLKIPAVATAYNLPIGYSTSVYRPANINFTTAPSAGSLNSRSISGIPSTTGLPLTESNFTSPYNNINSIAPDYWVIGSDVTGGTYNIKLTGNGQTGVVDYTKTTLIKRSDAASSWALLGTFVTTTGSNSAPVLERDGLTTFSEFAIGGVNPGVLPLSLTSFNALLQNNLVVLNWATTNETNMSVYEVEKSIDALNYNKVASVNALNNTTNNNYTTNDNMTNGTVFYRLKMIERNGSYKYSKVIALNTKKQNGLNVFPNPVKNDLFVTHTKANANANIEIAAADGKVLSSIIVAANSMQTTLSVSTLPTGSYTLIYNSGTEKNTIKFVKK